MTYTKIEDETIDYSIEDIAGWVKVFASRQLGTEITDEMILIPKEFANFKISVNLVKKTSNNNSIESDEKEKLNDPITNKN